MVLPFVGYGNVFQEKSPARKNSMADLPPESGL
jgi:hypothetical protein